MLPANKVYQNPQMLMQSFSSLVCKTHLTGLYASNILNGQFCNQMFSLNTLFNNLGNIYSRMQGGLGGLSSVKMGQWNQL
jgi:hypothetical protein